MAAQRKVVDLAGLQPNEVHWICHLAIPFDRLKTIFKIQYKL